MSGKPLSKDYTYLDLTPMSDLDNRTILSTNGLLNNEASITSKTVEDIKADMDRLGLAYALLMAEQFRHHDQIPDWLRRQEYTHANFLKAHHCGVSRTRAHFQPQKGVLESSSKEVELCRRNEGRSSCTA